MSGTTSIYKIDGQLINPPTGHLEFEVTATFDHGSVEANFEASFVTFVNEAAQIIRNWIAGGLTGTTPGIFEGPSFTIEISGTAGIFVAFNGYLDLTEYEEISPVKVRCKIKKSDGLNSIQDLAGGLTAGFLLTKGVITPGDFVNIPYVVEKEFNFAEFAILSFSTLYMFDTLQSIIKELGKDVANIAAHFAGGITGPISSLIALVAMAALDLAYAIIMVILITNYLQELISFFFSAIRYHKGIKWTTLLEKYAEEMGYDFSTTIAEMQNLYYLPSKTEKGELTTGPSIQEGIPTQRDFGYKADEALKFGMDAFFAKLSILPTVSGNFANTIHLEALVNDAFWFQQATFTMPDSMRSDKREYDESIKHNTSELQSTRFISLLTDPNDFWTLENFLGTNFEVHTHPQTVIQPNYVQLKGLDETSLRFAMMTRKDGLNAVETALLFFAQIGDQVILSFGQQSNFAGLITQRVGMGKMGTGLVNVAKVVYMVDNGSGGLTIPANHRQIFSAKQLNNLYHVKKSWVNVSPLATIDLTTNQKRVFENRVIPFGLADFLILLTHSYFYYNDNNASVAAKIIFLKWIWMSDRATTSFWIKQQVTANLQETTKEAQ